MKKTRLLGIVDSHTVLSMSLSSEEIIIADVLIRNLKIFLKENPDYDFEEEIDRKAVESLSRKFSSLREHLRYIVESRKQ